MYTCMYTTTRNKHRNSIKVKHFTLFTFLNTEALKLDNNFAQMCVCVCKQKSLEIVLLIRMCLFVSDLSLSLSLSLSLLSSPSLPPFLPPPLSLSVAHFLCHSFRVYCVLAILYVLLSLIVRCLAADVKNLYSEDLVIVWGNSSAVSSNNYGNASL